MTNEQIIEEAKLVTKSQTLSFDNTAGGVGAAIFSEGGNLYKGVCIDTASSMGFCAEHGAIAAMITAGESRIKKVVAVCNHEAIWYVLPPCGRCREFMKQISEDNLEAEVVLGKNETEKLKELLPHYKWPEPM